MTNIPLRNLNAGVLMRIHEGMSGESTGSLREPRHYFFKEENPHGEPF